MKRRLLLASLFVGLVVYGFAQPKINQYEYWFDTDLASKTVANITPVTSFNLNTSLPTNNLPIGLHTLQMRFRETTGAWSSTTNQYFVKPKSTSSGAGLISQYEYWFDTDYAGKTTQSVTPQSELSLVSSIATNQLSVGLHTFQICFREGNGAWSSTTTQYFVKPKSTSGSAGLISQYEYWFDTDYAGKTTQSVTPQSELSLVSSIATNQLLVGLHTFQIRFKEGSGAWSSTTTQYFVKPKSTSGSAGLISQYEYWFDTDYAGKTTQAVTPQSELSLVSSVATNQLSVGLHTFQIRFMEGNGSWSSTTTQYFVKPKSTSGSAGLISQYEYWFDTDYAGKTTQAVTPQSELSLVSSIATNQLSVGLHTFQIRFMEGNGSWSSTTTQYFVKPKSTSGSAGLISQYEYWFDTDYAGKTTQAVTPQSELSLVSSIATNQFSIGLHTFQIRFMEGNGSWSSTTTQHFLKPHFNTPFTNTITAYRYWLGTAFDKKIDVEVNPTNPLLLNNLLIPISASRRATPNDYEFIVSEMNGNHVIYQREALFNIQFKDSVGQWSSTSIDTINYRYPVDAICDTLQMRVEKVNQLPQSDTLHFYLFDANAGDSIILQTNKGLLVDLFDAEGNNIKTIERTKSLTGDTLIINGYTPWYALVHGFGSSIGTYSICVRKTNVAPFANAGADQVVDEGALVVLNGAASNDSDGQAISYSWIAPDEILLDDSTSATPSFLAPMVHADTMFVFTLNVSDGLLECLPDTVLITVRNIPVPENLVLSKQTIGNGSVRCFNALDTITVAGIGRTVVLENNSTATLIAGKTIRFLPGFHAQEGSSMEAYITTDGTFCDGQTASVAEQPQEKSIKKEVIQHGRQMDVAIENQLKIYPNPNNGNFTIQTFYDGESRLMVTNILGQKVYGPICFNRNVQVLLTDLSKGIYLCRIQNQQGVQTRKIEIK